MRLASRPLLRRLFRDERGQTIVLGALLLFFVFIAVMVTFAIGHRTREKIKLQALTDSTAYSTAVAEARTFNYIAFTNRARVAHEVAILSIQSHISYISYMEGIMRATGYALRIAAGVIAPQVVECPFSGLCCTAPADARAVWKAASYYLGNDFPAYGWYHQNWHQNRAAEIALHGAATSHFVAIGAIAADQVAIVAELGMKMQNQSFGATAAQSIDPKIVGSHPAGLYNLNNLRGAIHVASGESPASNDDWAEITSATRYPNWVTNRSFVHASAHWWTAFGIATSKMISNCAFLAEPVWDNGNAKVIGTGPSSLSSLSSTIHRGGDNMNAYGTGYAYAAEDHGGVAVEVGCWDICFGAGGWNSKAGLWSGPSSQNAARHFFAHGSPDSDSSLARRTFLGRRGIYVPHARYKWGPFSNDLPDKLWNFPHNVALLKKPMGTVDNVYDFELNMKLPFPMEFKTRNNRGDSEANGEMAALAGSLVYYHNAGSWKEPPSFWNPFWRAKLHPVTTGGKIAAYAGHTPSGQAALAAEAAAAAAGGSAVNY